MLIMKIYLINLNFFRKWKQNDDLSQNYYFDKYIFYKKLKIIIDI